MTTRTVIFRVTWLLCFLLISGMYAGHAQNLIPVTYEESDAIITNPERGFYTFTEYTGGSPLSLSQVQSSIAAGRTLIQRNYTISDFRDSDISESWLDVIRQDFQTIREGGAKAVVRFRYSRAIGEEDAPLEIVLRHLDQLKPILEDNYDVINVMDAGFIGAWGEWHNSTNNLTTTENMRNVLFKVLEVLPKERMSGVRTPKYKWAIYGTSDPVSADSAFNQSNIARTAHYNDGFLASRSDLGTYDNPGPDRNILSQDTRYLSMGGETGGGGSSDFYRQCDYAVPEMDKMNWSYLNSGWYGPTLEIWEEQGCMDEVKRRLGYRFVLNEGRYSETVRPGGSLYFELELENKGFAAPFNPRGLQAVIRNFSDPEIVYEVDLPEDPRFWLGGDTISIQHDLGIPEDLEDGFYQLFLFLPDPVPALKNRPEYAIRTANAFTWEEETGYNYLDHAFSVDSSAEGEDYEGDMWFSPKLPTSVEQTDARPSRIRLHQNYPNPFNPNTVIEFDLPAASYVTIEVFNMLGQKVAEPAASNYGSGTHSINFDASELNSGLYLYRLTAGDYSTVKTMMLLK
ncbi:MAG: DUF4832 domain-containing protein [Balneolales bacterium]